MFGTWVKIWLEEKKNYVKESTYANYRTLIINHLVPEFGNMSLKDIDYNIIQKSILNWATEGRVDGKGGLSIKTIKDMVVVLKMCLRDADIDERQITKHSGITYPVKKCTDKSLALNETQFKKYQEAILKNLNTETMGFLICLFTGLRIGELCALKWSDINMEEKIISINKTIQRIYIKNIDTKGMTHVTISAPKSPKSIRVVPIAENIFDVLYKRRQDNKCYVITGTEKYIEPRLYRKHYLNFITENSLEYIHFHGLRHTFATRCIAAGADYKTVSELLGHASVNMTLNLYVHPHLDEKRKCVNLL